MDPASPCTLYWAFYETEAPKQVSASLDVRLTEQTMPRAAPKRAARKSANDGSHGAQQSPASPSGYYGQEPPSMDMLGVTHFTGERDPRGDCNADFSLSDVGQALAQPAQGAGGYGGGYGGYQAQPGGCGGGYGTDGGSSGTYYEQRHM
mmetsp:Transcript_18556/g.55726  ORF Transcript_18556/g.55726 Transcript_18556/m.55726 type:complete len:149 (+) Transcript_18556:1-447(+)